MLNSAQYLGANRYRVSLESQRSAIVRDTQENEAWNLRTLSLMMRAGLIRVDSEEPPAADDTTEDEGGDAFHRYITSTVIEITDSGHRDRGSVESTCRTSASADHPGRQIRILPHA